MTTLYKADKKAGGRNRPQKSIANTESSIQVRCGGAWIVGASLVLRAARVTLSQASLRDDVMGFRCFLNGRHTREHTRERPH